MKSTNQKKQLYLSMADALFALQRTYNKAAMQLRVLTENQIPKSLQDIQSLEEMLNQLSACTQAVDQIELIKNSMALALLSEGALISIDELGGTLVIVQEFLESLRQEKEMKISTDKMYLHFLKTKASQLEEVKQLLETILEYKIDRGQQFENIRMQ